MAHCNRFCTVLDWGQTFSRPCVEERMRNPAEARSPQVFRWLVPVVLVGVAISAWGQAKPQESLGAMAILERAARQYSNLKSYRITCQETYSSQRGPKMQPQIMSAIKGPGGRYRLEGNDQFGTAIQVSNGKYVWVYHPRQNTFTRRPATGKKPNLPNVLTPDNSAIVEAANLLQSVTRYNGRFKSAIRVPDENLTLNGRTLKCYVIVLTNKDRRIPAPYPFTDTIWIEKTPFKIRKIVQCFIETFNQAGSPPVTFPAIRSSVYPQVILNQPIPDSVFRFTPPPKALWVAAFRYYYHLPPNLSPDTAVIFSIVLKSSSGSRVPLKSFRGHPVLIDLWATWCAPCYEAFPELDRIYRQTRNKGLVIASIDQNDIAKDAQAYIEKMHYPWRNFHDDGEIDKVFGTEGVPRTILIDAKGEVVFDKVTPTKQQLHAAIAKLGPRYAAVLAHR